MTIRDASIRSPTSTLVIFALTCLLDLAKLAEDRKARKERTDLITRSTKANYWGLIFAILGKLTRFASNR